MFSSRWSEFEILDYEIMLDDSPRDFLNLASIKFLFQILFTSNSICILKE